jgi:hypothetical protein
MFSSPLPVTHAPYLPYVHQGIFHKGKYKSSAEFEDASESASMLPWRVALCARTTRRAPKVFSENINLHTRLFYALGVIMQSVLQAANFTVW